ncbi:ribonuclease H-like domain-containing protein [Tanacetum coccineum]
MLQFDKRKVECFNCHNTGHFARECKFKGSKEGNRQEAGRGQDFKPVRTEKEALMTIDEGQINWVEQTADEELNHALMAFTVNNEVSMCSKLCLDSYNALQAKYDELQSEFGDQEAALIAHKLAMKKYRRIGMKAVKDKDALQNFFDSWSASSKNLWKLVDCGMSSTVKIGLGYGIKSNAEVLGYEEEISRVMGNKELYLTIQSMIDHIPIPSIEQACSFMLCDLDFEPLSLSLSSLPSCDLMSLTNMLILLHYLESFKSELAEVFVFKS